MLANRYPCPPHAAGQQEVAAILGSWQGTVMAESPEGSGEVCRRGSGLDS